MQDWTLLGNATSAFGQEAAADRLIHTLNGLVYTGGWRGGVGNQEWWWGTRPPTKKLLTEPLRKKCLASLADKRSLNVLFVGTSHMRSLIMAVGQVLSCPQSWFGVLAHPDSFQRDVHVGTVTNCFCIGALGAFPAPRRAAPQSEADGRY